MNPPPAQLRAIFDAALDRISGPDRDAYVEEACQGDEALLARVRALLQAYEEASGFLADPSRSSSQATGPTGENAEESDTVPIRPASTNEIKMPTVTFDHPVTEGPGTRIGPYKLLQAIGEGGMGSVFMAEQERPIRRRVALKVIKAGMDTLQVVARFEAERQALAMMDHTNIAKVLDAGATKAGRPFFVMELVKGIPITRFCDEARLTPKERLELFIPVCQAIQHAHQKGIIHRDIKPSNVLVTLVDGNPVPKVIDFGVAKAINQRLTEQTLFTQFGAIVGTPEYMSPEQAEISAMDVDTRSDIYSLGVLLYELLTGSTPLDRETLRRAALAEILKRIREEEPPRPSTRLSGSGERLAGLSAVRNVEPARLTNLLRGDLDAIVMKSLEKDRSRRYESAVGFARDIQRYLEGDPVEATPPSARYRLGKFARKHRSAIAMASAFALLLVMATVVSVTLAVAATRAKSQAEKMAEILLDVFRKPDPELKGASLKVSEYLDEASKDLAADPSLSTASRERLGAILDSARSIAPDALMADLLEPAYRKLVADRSLPPLMRANLFHRLGSTFHGLARYDIVSDAYRSAYELKKQALGPTHRETLESMAEVVFEMVPNPEGAESFCREALALCEQTLGHYDRTTILCRYNLSMCVIRSHVTRAIPLAEENLRLAEIHYPPGDVLILNGRHALAYAYGIAKRINDALPLARRTYDEKVKYLGPDHPSTLLALHTLGWLVAEQGDLAEAMAIEGELLKQRRKKLGVLHTETLRTLWSLIWVQYRSGHLAEAEKLLTDTLEFARTRLDARHPDFLDLREALLIVDAHRGRAEKVVADAEDILRIVWETKGADKPQGHGARFIADALWWAGRRDKALALLARYADLIENAKGPDRHPNGPDHPEALAYRMTLAEFLFYEARFDESLAQCARIADRVRKVFGPEDRSSIHIDYIVAAIESERTRTTEAVARLRKAVVELGRFSGPADPTYNLIRAILADAAFSVGFLDEAEAIWSEALPLLTYDMGLVAAWGGWKSRLGSIYLDRKEFVRAEPLILAAYHDLEACKDRLIPLYKDRPAQVAARIIGLYQQWGKPEKVAEWRKRIDQDGE